MATKSTKGTKGKKGSARPLFFMLGGFSLAVLLKNGLSGGQELFSNNTINYMPLITEGIVGGIAAGVLSSFVSHGNKQDVTASITGVVGAVALTLVSDLFQTTYLNVYGGGSNSNMSSITNSISGTNSSTQSLINQSPNSFMSGLTNSINNTLSGLSTL